MVTKEQAANATYFNLVSIPKSEYIGINDCLPDTPTVPTTKPYKFRANGKLKTYKRDATRFQLPIKHGLYTYAYITENNAHLFEVIS